MATGALYKFIRPLLFWLPAETSHSLTFASLKLFYRLPGAGIFLRSIFFRHLPKLPVSVMGLHFPNPLGLAAGLDKNGEYIKPLADFGFGFIEIGTITPRPQPGNPAPRLFRLASHAALINRLGFNNVGVYRLISNLAKSRKSGLIGINIGINRDTPIEHAVNDYLSLLQAVYLCADYVTINISSPNTAGLRDLQNGENLSELLRVLKAEQATLAGKHGRNVPIALKVAPDLDDDQVKIISSLVLEHNFDAVIATNTTLARPGLEREPLAIQTGGLSGQPLKRISTNIIRKLYAHLQGKVPIIGVGGIENADDAWEKLVAGADLIQLYTALIYEGPSIVKKILQGLSKRVSDSGFETLIQAITQARKS